MVTIVDDYGVVMVKVRVVVMVKEDDVQVIMVNEHDNNMGRFCCEPKD